MPDHKDYDEFSEQEGEKESFTHWVTHNSGVMAVLVAILIQTTAAVWWASSVATQLIAQNQVNVLTAETLNKITLIIDQNAERLTRVETVQQNVVKILDMISSRQVNSIPPGGQPKGP